MCIRDRSYAGIKFLDLEDEVSEIFEIEEIIPSAGQGIIALQCRQNDQRIISILKKVNHEETYIRACVEKNILKVLDGDCETAIGAHSRINGNKLVIEAELFSLDGSKRFYVKSSKELKYADQLGKEVGKILKKKSKESHKK